MRRTCFTFLVLAFVVAAAGDLPAQTAEEVCVVTLEGQNRNRTVAGAINVECGFAYEPHDAPFGNWGVSSNYSSNLANTDQFRGWKWKDGPSTKRQWNSCTTREPQYAAPNCTYYNADGCTTQASSNVVVHGRLHYRLSATSCPPAPLPDPQPTEPQTSGCRAAEGEQVSQASNYMTLYELDGWFGTSHSGDGHDLVETLYFPGTSVRLRDCSHGECPEQASGWVDMNSSTSSTAHVEAEVRMKAKATLHGSCEWNWD